MDKSQMSIEDKLKIKVRKQFNDNDFKLIKDLFKELCRLEHTNFRREYKLSYLGYSHGLYYMSKIYYTSIFHADSVDKINTLLFDKNVHSFKYKQYLSYKFRPGYHFSFSGTLVFRTDLEDVKSRFSHLFFKSKLASKYILQIQRVNDFVEVDLIKMSKSFSFKIDNPLLNNMIKSVETINGALTILNDMKNDKTTELKGMFHYSIKPNSLSSDDIEKRILDLQTERNNLQRRINNMQK